MYCVVILMTVHSMLNYDIFLTISTSMVLPVYGYMENKGMKLNENFIHLIHRARQIISPFTKQCHCLHLHSPCPRHPHTHS